MRRKPHFLFFGQVTRIYARYAGLTGLGSDRLAINPPVTHSVVTSKTMRLMHRPLDCSQPRRRGASPLPKTGSGHRTRNAMHGGLATYRRFMETTQGQEHAREGGLFTEFVVAAVELRVGYWVALGTQDVAEVAVGQ